MVAFGRVVCVAFPFILCLASIIAMLVAGLAGITDKSLYMFEINTTDFSVSTSSLLSLIDRRSVDPALLQAKAIDSSSNVTAEELGIGQYYDVSVWAYCYTPWSGSRNCSKGAYNWAQKAVNETEDSFNTLAATYGTDITLPSTVTKGLKVFVRLSRWTQIVFIVAFIALLAEIVIGLFSSCSRAISCLVFLVGAVAAVATVATAALATATASVVVGVVEASAKTYGVTGRINTHFLAAVWIAAAAALSAAFFWMLSVCCCASDHSRRSRSVGASAMAMPKINDKSYQPLNDPHNNSSYYNNASYAPQYGAPQHHNNARSDLAYEPYSHGRV